MVYFPAVFFGGLSVFGDFQEQQWDTGQVLLPDLSHWGCRCGVGFGHGGKQHRSRCPQPCQGWRGSLCLGENIGVLGADWHRLAWGRRVWEGKVNCSCAGAILQRRNSFPEGFWRIGCCFSPLLSLRRTTHLPTEEHLPSFQVPAVGRGPQYLLPMPCGSHPVALPSQLWGKRLLAALVLSVL